MAVPGLRREEWTGASYSEEEFRELAEVLPGMPFIGTGGLGERVWSGPAITVTGIDAPPVDKAVNAVVPYARAKLNLRVHPEQDPEEAQAALDRATSRACGRSGSRSTSSPATTGNGFAARTSGPAYDGGARRASRAPGAARR